MIELRRLKPIVSHARSYDDETFETLPMIVNPQPMMHRSREFLVEPISNQYFPSSSYTTGIDNEPLVYRRFHTPTLIERRPFPLYRSCETPVTRIVRVPRAERSVHLPKHTEKIVNRFLNNLEQAHDHQYIDGNESDSSINDCYVCRQLRSAMNDRRRRSTSDGDLYRSSRIGFEDQYHGQSKNCKTCRLLEHSDQSKHVHMVKTFPSNNQSTGQASLYPAGYTTFVDQTTGLTYAYDPSWQYDANPAHIPSHPSTMDKSTYTRILSDNNRHKSNDKTVIIHTSRNPTPKIVIEQPRRHHRRSRKNRSTTIVTERITRIPHTRSTT